MRKSIRFIALALVLFLMPYARAEWDKAYTDRMFRERFEPFRDTMNRKVDVLNRQIDNANNSIAELKSTIKKLQATNKDLTERVGNIDGKQPPDPGPLLPKWAIFIIMTVCAIVIVFVILVFWPQKKSNSSTSVVSPSRPRCPRCGWEYNPGDAICKNPDCKTQF